MRKQLLLWSPLLTLLPLVSQAQIENTEVGRYFKTQGMIALPTSWQPWVATGSFIYVDWTPVGAGRATLYRFRRKTFEPPTSDIPTVPENLSATAAAKTALSGTSADISFSLGKYSPELRIGHGSRIDVPETTFSVKGWGLGAHAVNTAVRNGNLNQELKDGTYDTIVSGGHRMFKGYAQGYLVTSVFSVENLVITVTKDTKIEASLQTLAVGKCTAEIPASQFSDPPIPKTKVDGTSPSNPSANTVKKPKVAPSKDVGADAGAGTVLPTVPGPGSAATLTICHTSDVQYSMRVKPGVPIAFTATELIYDENNNPAALVTGRMQDLRDAMKYPD